MWAAVRLRAARTTPIKLSSNEFALGPSPEAIAAFDKARSSLHLYPDGGATACAKRWARFMASIPTRIVCGNGSGEILTLLADAYLRPGDEVLFSAHAFLLYRIATLANSAMPVVVPEKNLRVDVDAMLKAVSPRTRIVYLANPNNPTGSYLTSEEVRRFHAGLPPSTLFVIDAAYAEYVRTQRLRFRHRDGVAIRQRRDDADLFESSTAWRACAWAGRFARRTSSMCSIVSAGRSTCRCLRRPRPLRRCMTAACRACRRS